MNTAHSETGGSKYLLWTSSLYVFLHNKVSKKNKPRICKKQKIVSPPQNFKDSVDSWRRFLNEQKHTMKIRFPDFRFSLPLWKEENLVNQMGAKNRQKIYIVFGSGSLPIRSMYGLFTYLWLIFTVTVSTYSIHGSYGLHRLHRTWIIYLADSGALSSPILLENDTSGLFAGCFSCRLYGHPCWWTLFQAPIS